MSDEGEREDGLLFVVTPNGEPIAIFASGPTPEQLKEVRRVLTKMGWRLPDETETTTERDQ